MANMETMTIHKALTELKILADRVPTAIRSGIYCTYNKHCNSKISGISVDDYKNAVIRGSYDKANDLLKRYYAIKKAVTLSNAKTIVNINGVEYTVAEAIWMMQSGMEYKETLLSELKDQYNKSIVAINKENKDLNKNAENYVTGLFGSKEAKVANAEIETAKSKYIENNTVELIDPISIRKQIEILENEIAAFKSEVDSALSVSNATTVITVEY